MWRGYDHAGYGPAAARRHRVVQGPSPWVPVTILAVIVLITALPGYMTRAPPAAYHHHTAAVRRYSSSSRFPGAALWVPVLGVIALQFFATPWQQQHGFYNGSSSRGGLHGARPGVDTISYDYHRRRSSWWNPYNYNPYNVHHQRGIVSAFMDYGGHWLLILLGIAVFTIVGASSSQTIPPPPLFPVHLAPLSSWGFPWSLFF